MGNYRQHVAFGTFCGVVYSVGATLLVGLNWVYATIAVMLSALGGLLPDLDSPSSFGLRGFTGILGVVAALIVWQDLSTLSDPPGFEFHLWAVIAAYLFVRYGVRRIMARIAVHRGMFHSVPTGMIWGAIVYLSYPSEHHAIRLAMAGAVMLGFLSHLVLDEACSVDLQGARVNKAFGSALKFWSDSPVSTIVVYLVLSLLCRHVTKVWPDEGLVPENLAAPAPAWPYPWPKSWIEDDFREIRRFIAKQSEKLPGRLEQAKAAGKTELNAIGEDLGKLGRFAEKQVGGVDSQSASKARDFVEKNLPETADAARDFTNKRLPKALDAFREFKERDLPKAGESLKKVAEAVAPSGRRR
ncbi:MAG: metal-dependent hydrolase [Isosphaeraceae bacterium]|nr:metal-dependent hydrolase [Isosphaeraceae bacterium]